MSKSSVSMLHLLLLLVVYPIVWRVVYIDNLIMMIDSDDDGTIFWKANSPISCNVWFGAVGVGVLYVEKWTLIHFLFPLPLLLSVSCFRLLIPLLSITITSPSLSLSPSLLLSSTPFNSFHWISLFQFFSHIQLVLFKHRCLLLLITVPNLSLVMMMMIMIRTTQAIES